MIDSVSNIWQKVLQGDDQQWSRLVRTLAPLVFTVARRAGLNERDAEDCAQQTWLALYKGRHDVKDPASLPAWLIRVVSRKAARMVRQRARQTEFGQEAESTSPTLLPDEELIRLERLGQLELAFGQLDERCRRVLRAIFFSPPELTYNDLAQELGMSPNSLGPTRTRCINKLRKILRNLGYL